MNNFYRNVLPVLFCLSLFDLNAATYYSQGSLDPSDKSNWNTSRTGGSGSGKPLNFTTAGDIFIIQNTHSMSTTSAWTVSGTGSQVQIEGGGSLTLSSFTINTDITLSIARTGSFTMNNGGAGDDLVVNGIFSNGGTLTYGTGATGIVQSGGKYQHNQNGGTLYTFTWSTGSTCEITGVISSSPSGLGQTFHHFTWNCPSQSSTGINLSGSFTRIIKGNFTIQNTGSPTDTLYLANGSNNTDTIEGDLVIASGACFSLALGTGSPYLMLKGNLTVNGILTKNSSGTGAPSISFANSSTKTFTNTGTISNQIHFIDSTGILDMGSSILSGTGTFALLSGAGLIIGDVNGITSSGATGNVQVTGTRTYNTATNYTYNGSSSQAFGNGLPATVNHLSVNNGNTGMALNSALTVNGTLTLTSGKIAIGANTLTLNGNFSGSSSNALKGNGSSSNLSIGGSGTIGNLFFDQSTPGTTNRIQHLTYNRSSQIITLGNALEMTGTLTPTAGTLATGGNLTLVSNASGTARIAAGSGSYLSGNVTVQRYIPAVTRRYRMLSSPVSSFDYTQLIDDIFVTGTGGTAQGFDSTTLNQSSVFTYKEATTGNGRGWKEISNISNTLSPGLGSLVFVRGDRTLASPAWYTYPYVSQNAVTIDYTGAANTGTISPAITYTSTGDATADGWNLVGNPYASPIDWTSLTKSNLSSFYYVLDPATGSYVSNNGSNLIASGQAFYIQATGISPTISFTESAKTASSPVNYFKTQAALITVKMQKDSLSSDVAFLEFKAGSSSSYDPQEDALKFTNSAINFGWTTGPAQLQYSSVPELTGADTFPLFVSASAGSYTFYFSDLQQIPAGYSIYLIDLFTHSTIDLRVNSAYPFGITSNAASYGNNRFVLVFSDPAALPVTLVSFSAQKINHGIDVHLSWETASEKNNDHFTLERSIGNLAAFEEISTIQGHGNSNVLNKYTYIDQHVPGLDAQTIYYRLKQVDKNGTTAYSETRAIVSEDVAGSHLSLTMFPNPASDYIQVKAGDNAYADILVTDLAGRVVWQQNHVSATDHLFTVPVAYLDKGTYFLTLVMPGTAAPSTARFIRN